MANAPILNASSVPLSQTTGNLPQMGDALYSWFQNVTFTLITKTVVNYQLVETEAPLDFRGVVQPFSPKMLMMKPVGQRQWTWLMVHALPDLILKVDDRLVYQGTKFRVMERSDWKEYQYVEYHLAEDYT